MKKGFRFIILMLAAFMMPSVVNAEVATVTTDLDFSKNSVQVSYNNPDGEIYWNNNQQP